MTLSGLVTFWALIVAAYSVLPEYWKFKLKAFVGLTPAVFAFIISSALVSLSMFVDEIGLTISIRGCQFTVTPVWMQISAYIVLFLFVLWVMWQLQKSRVTSGNLLRLRQFLTSLTVNKQFNLIAAILKDNIPVLTKIYDHRPFWRRALKSKGNVQDDSMPFLSVKPTEHQEKVLGVLEQIMSDKELTEFLVGYDVNVLLLVVEAAEDKAYEVMDYLHSMLDLLIRKPNSELYREVFKHQNIDYTGKRDLKDSKILSFLFGDTERAKKWWVWKPIGEYIFRYLHDRPGGIEDEYNREANYYTDLHGTERYSDPVFVGLEYFDFMVKEALIQSTEWHMWLYYLRYWVEEIVGKLSYNPDEWQKGNWEYPTKYAFLLYKIIHYQLKWFDFALKSNLNIKLENLAAYDNSNILKCASQCLANCLHLIATSELPDSYKRSLITPWWNNYFMLKSSNKGNYSDYADFLLQTMITEVGGDIMQGAFRRGFEKGVSLHLLGGLVSSLTHVDEVLVDHKTYSDRLADMKGLVQLHILPLLARVSPEVKPSVLRQALGDEFRLDDDAVFVSNRFGMWTHLIKLK